MAKLQAGKMSTGEQRTDGLREKMVAASSTRMIVIADGSKKVARLGAFPLPIEVVSFGAKATMRKIEKAAAGAGATGALSFRMKNGAQFVTDNGNYIIDGAFGVIPDAKKLALALEATPGVVDHGLFIGLADLAILGAPDGVVTVKV